MSVDSRRRFSATADDYRRHRPDYPAELIEWILGHAGLRPPATIADVGCGTGISSRLFASRGFDVVGVDPNEDMLAHARAEGGARFERGEATATGLADQSVDLVTAAQAFHWFDVPPTLRELSRILRPGGACAAFWNVRAETPFLDAYERLLLEHSVEYAAVPRPDAAIGAIRASPTVTAVREAEFRHVQPLDRDGLLGRARSSSYVAHGVRDKEGFERDLLGLYDAHQSDGLVEFLYRSVVVLWRPRPDAGD